MDQSQNVPQKPQLPTGVPPPQASSSNDPLQSVPTVSSSVKPTTSLDVQPVQAAPIPSEIQFNQPLVQKPSKLRIIFVVLGVVQALGVATTFIILYSVAGQPGSEFIAMALSLTIVPTVTVIALINLVSLPIYLAKHKVHGRGLVFSILSLLLSMILVASGIFACYRIFVVAPKHIKQLSEQSAKHAEQLSRNYVASGANPTASRDNALKLMHDCDVDYFVGYTGDLSVVKDSNTKAWLNSAEQSRQGVAILKNSPKTYVFTSKSMTAALQDTARKDRQTCYDTRKLYIMIDDWVETEYPAGNWTKVKQ